MKQYLDLCQRIIDEGTWIENERTGKRCLTVINADLQYDVKNNQFPMIQRAKATGNRQLLNFLVTFVDMIMPQIFVH